MTTKAPLQYYYSAASNGFYTTDIFEISDMPSDAVEISQTFHSELLEKQSGGYDIAPGSLGLPESVRPINFPTPTSSAIAKLRGVRNALLTKLDVLFLRNLETGGTNEQVIAEKNRLRNITKLVTAESTVEEIDVLRASLGS